MAGRALEAAVTMVGGQSKLARLLGVSQPNVWHWLNKAERVPAEYVLPIEAATGGRVSRHDLRPDLFPKAQADEAAPGAAIDGEDIARAECYRLLARLLMVPPGRDVLAAVGHLLGGEGEFGGAIDALAARARQAEARAVEREYHALFIGLARGELLPYASYYLTGFLYEKPLARIRADMARLGIAQADEVSEPEDHIASLAESMAALILGAFGAPAVMTAQREFFAAHIASWAPRFFADLERAEQASFYKSVGRVGRLFLSIEAEAFALA